MILAGLGAASTMSAAQVQSLIVQSAQAHGVPVNIALGVASHESRFIPTVKNPGSSAAGLFQLVSSTQQTMGVYDPYDPQQNTDAAMALLSSYYAKYGNWDKALQAFSEGPVSVNAGEDPTAQSRGLISYVDSFDAGPILANVNPAIADTVGVGLPDGQGDFTGDTGGSGDVGAGVVGAPGVMEAVGVGLMALIGYMAVSG